MKQPITYILVPGLWDQRPLFGWFYLVVGKWWRLHGMRTVFCKMNWVSTESYRMKMKRLETCIRQQQRAGRGVVVVGVSAGGSMALIALCEHEEKVFGAVSISGLLKLTAKDRANPLYAKTSWFEAADRAERLSKHMDRGVRRRLLTLSGTEDDLINPRQEHIPGAAQRRVKGHGHLLTIVRILLIYPRTIKRFMHELHR